MCRIERKTVTLNWNILASLLLMRKITQLQKNGKKLVFVFLIISLILSVIVAQL
jgi:hypothetical protein